MRRTYRICYNENKENVDPSNGQYSSSNLYMGEYREPQRERDLVGRSFFQSFEIRTNKGWCLMTYSKRPDRELIKLFTQISYKVPKKRDIRII